TPAPPWAPRAPRLAPAGRRPPSRPLSLEPLEGRVVPATIPVTSLADAGPGTLRAAIMRANLDPAPDTITFAPSVRGAIALLRALPDLSTDMEIDGPGPSVLTVARLAAAGTRFRIFDVPTGVEVGISGLTITGGFASGGGIANGGGISNAGTLTVTDATFSDNLALEFGGGRGGGIFNV